MITAAEAQALAAAASCLMCLIPPNLVPYAILEAVRNIP